MTKLNKKALLAGLIGGLLGVALAVGGTALADKGESCADCKGHWTKEKTEEHLQEMTTRLKLTKKQQAEVRSIFEQARTRKEALKDQPRGPEKHKAMKDLHWDTEDKLYAALTCDQREGLRKLKREHRAERMKKRGDRHGHKGHHGSGERRGPDSDSKPSSDKSDK